MSSDVLVLNKNYYGIHICSWEKTMSLLFQGHAEVVDGDYNVHDFDSWVEVSKAMEKSPSGFVHTPTLKIAIPEIIRLTRYDKLPKVDVKFTRRNIYEHYKYTCCYCGEKFETKDLNLDHVIPKSKGGRSDWSNIVTSCIPCNTKKNNRTPEEAHMKLLVVPSKPKWKGQQSLLTFRSPFKIKESWQKIIDSAYWQSELEQ